MKEIKTVSVVVPCRNEEKYIGKCIEAFLSQTYPKDLYEVLICDGMSTDRTREIVNEYKKENNNVKLIDNKELSAPKGMNLGIKNSKADIIIIFGAHAYADKDFIKNNVEKYGKYDNLGCVGGPIETISENNLGNAISLALSSPFGVGNALFRYCKKEVFTDTVAFGAYRREVLDKIGYFDEELVRNQDDEINLRVKEAGYDILLSPDIQSYYYSRSSFKKLWKQYFQYGFWKIKVMKKHKKVASIRHLVPMLFVTTNVLGILGGIFFKPIFYLWLAEIILYGLLDIIYSVKLSKGSIKQLISLFVIFLIIHTSYGIGFLQGILNFYILKSEKMLDKNTQLSR